MKIESARQTTLSLIASSIEVTILSLERSSPIMLVPPEALNTMGVLISGLTEVRKTPRVTIRESA
jgi:hypothetical protein